VAHEVVQKAEERGPRFAALAEENERLGRLSDETVRLIREAGVMRLLQPTEHGGLQATPRDFAEAVMAVARHDGSAGWVCGVVGVHPWELAQMHPRLQEEVWGEDPDTWVASPYIPGGMAEPVEGGYRLTGRWPFSSGTDHADWCFLGAIVGDGSGAPAQPLQGLHVVLPRADYTIVPESWDTIGLQGTGSKDVVVDGAFVPTYRTVDQMDVMEGTAAGHHGVTDPLYRLPFGSMFPVGITAAVVGICEGLLEAHRDIQRKRVSITGAVQRDNPYTQSAAGEAAAEIQASRLQLVEEISRMHERLSAGGEITLRERAEARRNQIRCAWRAVDAADRLLPRSGGDAIRRSSPIQRFWRDAHVGLQHMIHVPGEVYHAAALTGLGAELPPELRMTL
jgi:3-hydroxy-9,10-secoandrosta-1,3,5(10)-triene-9,17-dione monooxygenase